MGQREQQEMRQISHYRNAVGLNLGDDSWLPMQAPGSTGPTAE